MFLSVRMYMEKIKDMHVPVIQHSIFVNLN